MKNLFLKLLLDSPRWAFFLLLIATPWAWGGVPVWIEVVWCRFCLEIAGAYVVAGLLRRDLSFPPVLVFLPVLWILLQGWWMASNALLQSEPQLHGFIMLHQHHPGWPGSLDRNVSLRMMWKVSALFSALYLAGDMARSNTWRKRLIFTLVLAGASVAAFGLFMRINSPWGIWPDIDRNNYPFGTFYYHANAAAYLNTALPISLACLLRSLFTETGPFLRAFWVCSVLLLISGALVCASKAGMVIAFALIVLLMLIFWITFHGRFDQMTFDLPPVFLWIVIFGMAAVMIVFIGQQTIMRRWQFALDVGDAVMSGRRQTALICLHAIPEAGWWGFGPGTFASMFPAVARLQQVQLHGVWLDAHQDYLQTILEWGKAGAVAWGTLFFGAMIRPLVSRFFWRDIRRYDQMLVIGLVLALLGCAVHALVDYPLQITSIDFNIVVLIGLLWSTPRWQLNTRSRRRRRVASGELLNPPSELRPQEE